MTTADLSLAKQNADTLFRSKRLLGFAIPAVILVYFGYIFFAFDLPGLAQRANLQNAVTLASDSWSHKVHVTRNNRTGEVSYAVEGERKGTYPEGTRPDWVSGE
ncbi:MAG: phosphonate ABC transporter, permease protein PhnE, partial [Pseudomonadota bacterium]